MKPEDAKVYYSGNYYKIGLHGKAYMFVNNDLVLSNKSAEEIEKEIVKEKKKSLSL